MEMATTIKSPPHTSIPIPAAHVVSLKYVATTLRSSANRGSLLVPSFCRALPTLMHDAATATTSTAKRVMAPRQSRGHVSDAAVLNPRRESSRRASTQWSGAADEPLNVIGFA